MTRTVTASMTAIVLASASAGAEPPRLADVFGDHMVVQRGAPVRVWGWATPGVQVRAQMGGHRGAAVVDAGALTGALPGEVLIRGEVRGR